jgi:hypothetical protein
MTTKASSIRARIPSVRLTRANVDGNGPVKADAVEVPVSGLVAYSQERGFTRIRLTGGQAIEVCEATEVIDQLVRSASTFPYPAASPRLAHSAIS